SLGPPGATIPDTSSRRGWRFENPVTHRLRVTLASNERISWMLIDDIVTGRADTRTVSAEYMFSPVGESTRDLWTALQWAPRVLGSERFGLPGGGPGSHQVRPRRCAPRCRGSVDSWSGGFRGSLS